MIQLDIRKWNNYGKALLYMKNGEILEALQGHRINIDRCLGMLNVHTCIYEVTSFAHCLLLACLYA